MADANQQLLAEAGASKHLKVFRAPHYVTAQTFGLDGKTSTDRKLFFTVAVDTQRTVTGIFRKE